MTSKAKNPATSFSRFDLVQRVQHVILIVAFTGLALTGLPQKFALESWAQAMIAAMGGIEAIRVIHRVLATVLMVEVVYHGGEITYKLFVLRLRPTMLPVLRDLIDLVQKVLYNLRLRQSPPSMGRYNFEEKLEYWALVWGMAIMILTGFLMWNPISSTRWLSGEFIPAARIAHGSEAVLAALAIIVWHMYSVHLRRFNPSMWTGKLSRHEMQEDHALELESLESGKAPAPIPPDVLRRRLRVFIPIAVIISGLLLTGIVWFVTFEQTAITTVPAYNIQVVPPELETITTPQPTRQP